MVLSVVVIFSSPPPASTTLMVKLPVWTMPGCSVPFVPMIDEAADAATLLRIERCNVSLNCCKGVCCVAAPSALRSGAFGSVCVFVAWAVLRRLGPLSGLPPNEPNE